MLCCEPIAWKVEYNAAILHSCEQTVNVFAQWYNIMVVYQCFLSRHWGAIKFAVNVTKSRSRTTICELDLLYSSFFLYVSYGK